MPQYQKSQNIEPTQNSVNPINFLKSKPEIFLTLITAASLAIVLGLVVDATVFLWQWGNNKKSAAPPPPVENNIANWQTYRNEEYGFEVKYPGEWEVLTQEGRIELRSGSKPAGDLETNVGLSISVMENDKKLNLEQIVINNETNKQDTYIYQNKENILIDGKPAFKADIGNWGMVQAQQYLIIANGKIYNIIIDGLQEYFKEPEKIVSTFKFIKPFDTSNWQTYRNEEWGFEGKYPENWYYKEAENSINFYIENKDLMLEGDLIFAISISIRSGQGQTPTDWAESKNKYNGSIVYLKLDGHDAAQVQDYLGRETFIAYNLHEYVIASPNFGDVEMNSDIVNVYNQILSTFKFIY